jgi:hypothetical protein
MEFTGRKPEIVTFHKLMRKKTASLVVCRGRRRIGKSTFVREGAKRADHYMNFEGLPPAEGVSMADQLNAFAIRLREHTSLPQLSFDNWPQAF